MIMRRKKMKKIVSVAVSVMLLTGTITALHAGGQKSGGGDANTITITHDKTGAPDYHPYFVKAGQELKTATGITLEPVGYPSTDVYTAATRSSLPTNSAPDLFSWWAGAWIQDLQKNGLLAPTTAVWDKYKADYSPGIRDMYESPPKSCSLKP
jgi:multiple sugar transport system substrate-binding protein/raffinose/stachyose/melibiose transport system substrate-binding protein